MNIVTKIKNLDPMTKSFAVHAAIHVGLAVVACTAVKVLSKDAVK